MAGGLYHEMYKGRDVVVERAPDGRWFAYVDRVLLEDAASSKAQAQQWARDWVDLTS